MRYTLVTLALAALSMGSPVPDTGAASYPPVFKISNVVHGGTGCPQGSIDVDWSSSRVFPIYFPNEFTAIVGPNANITDQRKNCQINFDLKFSSGYSFAILNADFAGWGDIDAGVTGDIISNYYFSGQTSQVTTDLSLPGPFTGKWAKRDEVPILVWSPCGGEALLNVNNEVRLTPSGGPGEGILSATHEDARFTQSLNFLWRQC